MDDLVENRRCLSCGALNQILVKDTLQSFCEKCGQKLIRHYYDLFQISITANTDEVKKAYRKMAMKWHPDRHPDHFFAANEYFKHINEAYAVLSTKKKRMVYDVTGNEGISKQPVHMSMDEREATRIFMDEMYTLSLELAFQNLNAVQIASQLIEKGCPTYVAEVVAQASASYRKRQVRIKARKPIIIAFISFVIAGLLMFKTQRSILVWVVLLYGIYQALHALYFIVTGHIPKNKLRS